MKQATHYNVQFRVQAATVRSLREHILQPSDTAIPPTTPGNHVFVSLPFSLSLPTPTGVLITNVLLLPPEAFQSLNPVPVPDEPASTTDGTTQTVTAKEELDAQ